MGDKIREWIGKYGLLSVGSFNPAKTNFYERLLSKMGIETEAVDTQFGKVLNINETL